MVFCFTPNAWLVRSLIERREPLSGGMSSNISLMAAEESSCSLDDSIMSIDELANVQGSFEGTNSTTYDEIVTFQGTMP